MTPHRRAFRAAAGRDGRKAFVAFVTAGDPVARAHGRDRARAGGGRRRRARAGRAVLGPAGGRARDPARERARARAGHDARAACWSWCARCAGRASCRCCSSATSTRSPRYGLERLASDARDAGVDGVLVTDLPPEEADEWLAVGAAARTSTPSSWRRRPARPSACARVARRVARLRLRAQPHRRDGRAGRAVGRGAGRWSSACAR